MHAAAGIRSIMNTRPASPVFERLDMAVEKLSFILRLHSGHYQNRAAIVFTAPELPLSFYEMNVDP
jgi:hypothetical protein